MICDEVKSLFQTVEEHIVENIDLFTYCNKNAEDFRLKLECLSEPLQQYIWKKAFEVDILSCGKRRRRAQEGHVSWPS
ncbi:Hypothetical predicted protein [Cloeon dipterum]|uniref:Uncharacterized protein n=1 Tax=Cloeon dipterum TaxID=197152 RepID=A0A8S1D1T4_9INSE|nr:Hypothetical predicted protein [Cloeon dipterum]